MSGIWKDGHMRAQCAKKMSADARRRQLVVTQAKIGIVEDLEEEKPVET